MAVPARPLQKPTPQQQPEKKLRRLRVVENPARKKQQERILFIKRAGITVTLLLMVVSVLLTQANITQMQNAIERQQAEYTEQMSMYDSLMYQLEGKVNLQNIEERARQLGLVKMQQNQTVYMRNNEETNTKTYGNGFLEWLEEFADSVRDFFGV